MGVCGNLFGSLFFYYLFVRATEIFHGLSQLWEVLRKNAKNDSIVLNVYVYFAI